MRSSTTCSDMADFFVLILYNYYMNKVNILLTEANGNLSDKREMIMDAVKAAEEYAFPKIKDRLGY